MVVAGGCGCWRWLEVVEDDCGGGWRWLWLFKVVVGGGCGVCYVVVVDVMVHRGWRW